MTVETIKTAGERVTIARVNVNEAGLMGLRFKVEKLNKRARRRGLDEVVVRILSDELVVVNAGEPDEFTARRYDVEIDGCEPCIDGWRLAARVEFNDTIGQVVRIAPGFDDDGSFEAYRTIEPICEHCNSRRRRNDVFVLQDGNGSRKIVGRNCLADFLRNGDAEGFAYYAERCELLAKLRSNDCEECGYDDCGYGSRVKPVKPIDEYLPVVSMMTRRLGWLGRTKARELNETDPGARHSATADNVSFYFYGRSDDKKAWIRENDLYVNDDDKDLAARAVEWAKEVDSSRNEYLDTIKRIAQAEVVDMERLDGYAASIIIAYKKATEREAERAEKAKSAPRKEYVGSIKERLRGLKVRVLRTRFLDSDWGVRTVVAMETSLSDGVIAPLVWFASGEKDFEEGEELTIDGTVKDQTDDERFGKQTILTRVSVK